MSPALPWLLLDCYTSPSRDFYMSPALFTLQPCLVGPLHPQAPARETSTVPQVWGPHMNFQG